ncbi:hypothetical protein KIN20_002817 [Parelaphostrongylus tenuis]|uniref:Uncharacterized protein n=1 Tax=Parelaphostrongylus tenuis TaxID=148309 RepID=A0AAD5LY98_PARTN|nr:hypothetical protein KIN20_002817 [Parelaphostrongylus tenuis]
MSSIKKKSSIRLRREHSRGNPINHDWQIKYDPTEDYELLVGGLKGCADLAPLTQPRRADQVSSTMKELLEKRRKLKLDPNATHLARLISNTSCR